MIRSWECFRPGQGESEQLRPLRYGRPSEWQDVSDNASCGHETASLGHGPVFGMERGFAMTSHTTNRGVVWAGAAPPLLPSLLLHLRPQPQASRTGTTSSNIGAVSAHASLSLGVLLLRLANLPASELLSLCETVPIGAWCAAGRQCGEEWRRKCVDVAVQTCSG